MKKKKKKKKRRKLKISVDKSLPTFLGSTNYKRYLILLKFLKTITIIIYLNSKPTEDKSNIK